MTQRFRREQVLFVSAANACCVGRHHATFSGQALDKRSIFARKVSTPRSIHVPLSSSTGALEMYLGTAGPIGYRFAASVCANSLFYMGARLSKQRLLTDVGLKHALFLGILLWTSLSISGWGLCVLFLILGSLATRIGGDRKRALGIAEKRGGARGPENLWGAAGVGAICAMIALLLEISLATGMSTRYAAMVRRGIYGMRVAYSASLATKMADTVSSEVGKAYGKTTYLITTLKIVPRGTEGAVSVEGTLAGVVAAALAGVYSLGTGVMNGGGVAVGIVIVAAIVGTTVESFIGATVQEDWGWSNEFVNFVNTLIGAVVAIGMLGVVAHYGGSGSAGGGTWL